MHPVQADTLSHLLRHPQRRFSELKPQDMDPHLFMYHFKKLIGMGLVDKQEDGYVLTREGLRHAGKISSRTLVTREQPTISTFIACQNQSGQWLLHQRAYQPFLGRKSFPYGKLHWGESLQEAATRELRDKTSLSAEKLDHCGNCYLLVQEGEELITHMLCHIFRAENLQGELRPDGEKGPCDWELVNNPADTSYYLPGFTDVFALAANPSPEFKEIRITLPERYAWSEEITTE
jgi:ADP-ribose pyrophosphatase YjhB (NUDIX family)